MGILEIKRPFNVASYSPDVVQSEKQGGLWGCKCKKLSDVWAKDQYPAFERD